MSINTVQRLVVEVDSWGLLERYLQLAMITALQSHAEIAVKIVDRDEEDFALHLPASIRNQDKHFPVILVSGWYQHGKKANSHFDDHGTWKTFGFDESTKTNSVTAAIQYIKDLFSKNGKDWRTQFRKKFGNGHSNSFNEDDGSVGLGCELRVCESHPRQVAISIVHIYYEK